MSLRLITLPAVYPVTLSEAKAHLREDSYDQDGRISSLIMVATEYVQDHLQKRFVTQTLEWVLQGFSECLKLPLAPVDPASGVGFVKYTDANGTVQTVDPSNYIVTSCGQGVIIRPQIGYCWPIAWPSAEPVVIRFTAGTDKSAVPEKARQAILLLIAHWYERRQAVGFGANEQPYEIPFGVPSLLMSEVWT